MEHIIKESEEQLLIAAQKTFETITFASVENSEEYGDEIPHPPAKDLFHSSIDIKMDSGECFRMELALSTHYVKSLVLSVNPGIKIVDHGYLIDLIGELINTLSGSFMLQIESLTGDFKLGLPVSQEGIGLSENAMVKEIYIIDDVNPLYVGIYRTN